MRLLVTAGPTCEDIDDVRYLTNRSSGRMGFAVAQAAARKGWEVTLVAGPVHLKTPPKVHRIDVRSAAEMFVACGNCFPQADAAIMAAAVADYTPAARIHGKRKKSGTSWNLHLEPTVDVLAWMGEQKRKDQVLVGFALEAGGVRGGRAEAQRKLLGKKLDLIVLNGVESLNASEAAFVALDRHGYWYNLGRSSKSSVALWLVRWIARHRKASAGRGKR